MVRRRLVWKICCDVSSWGSDTKGNREGNLALSMVVAREWVEKSHVLRWRFTGGGGGL